MSKMAASAEKGMKRKPLPVPASISSRKWVAAQNDLVVSEGDGEEGAQSKSQLDILNSIQGRSDDRGCERTGQSGSIWSSILLIQKTDQPVPVPVPAAPYIHPLAKRSASSLSERSLQVCTESLGSETGSDGFSSYASSEASDGEDDDKEELEAVSYKKRSLQPLGRSRPFPPPLQSLSRQNGSSLHVRSRRDNGRLVLEAVSVMEQSNFRAQREDGRLVLTFIDDPSKDLDHGDRNETAPVDAYEEEEEEGNQDNDMETEEASDEICREDQVRLNKLAIPTNKPLVFLAGWTIPDMLRPSGELVFIDRTSYEILYQYLRRGEYAALADLIAEQPVIIEYTVSEGSVVIHEMPELMVLRAAASHGCLVPSCKDTRRSVWFRRPHCIA
ncbi:hypothetical protein SAY86_020573 [Trapa natans]|uniref:FAF domain-containing protein n=1 Tax=Trapa natans TaxID=22666 RepID=A0AAN7LQQ7_TRANT|nr:hypothetical protein SAY86_020573 [Trapa natans]